MRLTKRQKRWSISLIFLAIFLSFALYPLPLSQPVKYYERETGRLKVENIAGENWLIWLYYNPVGEATLWTVARRKIVSSIYGDMMDSPSSADKVAPFIKEYKVDISIAKKNRFTTFNDFFTRELKDSARPVIKDSSTIVSPADGKILAYENINNADFYIKGTRFQVATFLNNPKLARKYENGTLIVVRLAPPDYHRYHFPVDGEITASQLINGDYYSVNPLALREMADVFWKNKREYAVIESPHAGKVIMSEVGATLVGSIIQTYRGSAVEKGAEKGYFKFGGSTVVLFFENGKIKVDDDLLANTSKGRETTIKMGARIATGLVK